MTMTATPSEIELFGRVLPRGDALHRQCVVCGRDYRRPLDANHHLCERCAADPAVTAAHVAHMLARVDAAIEAHHEAWAARQAALEGEVYDRWTALYTVRTQAEVRLARAERGLYRGVAEPAAAIAEARAALDKVLAKVARTEATGGEVADLIQAERAWATDLRRLLAARNHWAIAEQHIEAARGEAPF